MDGLRAQQLRQENALLRKVIANLCARTGEHPERAIARQRKYNGGDGA